MKKRSYGHGHLKFLIIAIFLMVMIDKFVMGGTRPYIEEARRIPAIASAPSSLSLPEPIEKNNSFELARLTPEIKMPVYDNLYQNNAKRLPLWRRNAVPLQNPVAPEQPKIVIVIDDLGISRKYTREVFSLPAPLTLAFLPYAPGVDKLAKEGHAGGHELMVHMPMEPVNGQLDTGDIFLSTAQSPTDFEMMLQKGLGAFDGYVGINNHMGSRLTQDKDAMQTVMNELHRRGLLFLDSRTIASSVAADVASVNDVPYATRDVFLDHDPSLEKVRESLEKVEHIALKNRLAIAIGHPKPHTIEALKEWLPTLAEKGIALVPISAVVTLPLPENLSSAPPSQSPEPPHP